ncbi:MAG TPA: patatin-like phospholipase family protein [Pyrinomonadaceae bacterium]|jgi:predicted acylesterase/phospholipase RssA
MAQYDVVFEGGGAKCFAFAGALAEFAAAGHTHRRLVGTSGGAVTALLCAAGYTPQELLAAISAKVNGRPRMAAFLDTPRPQDFSDEVLDNSATLELFKQLRLPGLPALGHALLKGLLHLPPYCELFSLNECGGFFAGVNIYEWLRERLVQKGMSPDITCKDFFAHTGSDLSLIVSDTSELELLILNHRTAPDCPVAWAARSSLSIPYLWREVVWRKEWGLYRGRAKAGSILIDGGALSNFPLWLFAMNPEDPFILEVLGPPPPEVPNLGLFLDDELPVPDAPPPPELAQLLGKLRTAKRIMRIVDTITISRDKLTFEYDAQAVCRLPTLNYSVAEFDMTDARRDALVAAGRAAMHQHLFPTGARVIPHSPTGPPRWALGSQHRA